MLHNFLYNLFSKNKIKISVEQRREGKKDRCSFVIPILVFFPVAGFGRLTFGQLCTDEKKTSSDFKQHCT